MIFQYVNLKIGNTGSCEAHLDRYTQTCTIYKHKRWKTFHIQGHQMLYSKIFFSVKLNWLSKSVIAIIFGLLNGMLV